MYSPASRRGWWAQQGGSSLSLAEQSANGTGQTDLLTSVSYAHVGVIGFAGPIDLQSLRLYGLPEAAPAVLNGTPLLPQSGQREFAAEVSWDLPSLAPGATSLIDVTVSGARAGDLAQASLVSSTRFIEINAVTGARKFPRSGG